MPKILKKCIEKEKKKKKMLHTCLNAKLWYNNIIKNREAHLVGYIPYIILNGRQHDNKVIEGVGHHAFYYYRKKY